MASKNATHVQARLYRSRVEGYRNRHDDALDVWDSWSDAGWKGADILCEALIALGKQDDPNFVPLPPDTEVTLTKSMIEMLKTMESSAARLQQQIEYLENLEFSTAPGSPERSEGLRMARRQMEDWSDQFSGYAGDVYLADNEDIDVD